MTDSDKKRFAALWVSYHEMASGKRPSIESVGLAYKLLRPYPIDLIEQALEVHGRTSPYAPKPADVAKILMGSAEDRARRAWLSAKEAMTRWGSHESVSLNDPWAHYAIAALGGWPSFGEIRDDEAPFREKDFLRFYSDAERMGLAWGDPGVPRHLPGRCEIKNRMVHSEAELVIRDGNERPSLAPKADEIAPALPAGDVSEEQQRRNIEGVGQLVAQVLSQ